MLGIPRERFVLVEIKLLQKSQGNNSSFLLEAMTFWTLKKGEYLLGTKALGTSKVYLVLLEAKMLPIQEEDSFSENYILVKNRTLTLNIIDVHF